MAKINGIVAICCRNWALSGYCASVCDHTGAPTSHQWAWTTLRNTTPSENASEKLLPDQCARNTWHPLKSDCGPDDHPPFTHFSIHSWEAQSQTCQSSFRIPFLGWFHLTSCFKLGFALILLSTLLLFIRHFLSAISRAMYACARMWNK